MHKLHLDLWCKTFFSAVQALDFAGTYGVLTLFGLIPAASVWSQRYGNNNRMTPFKVKRMSSQASCY